MYLSAATTRLQPGVFHNIIKGSPCKPRPAPIFFEQIQVIDASSTITHSSAVLCLNLIFFTVLLDSVFLSQGLE
jgi:hypothetical protein